MSPKNFPWKKFQFEIFFYGDKEKHLVTYENHAGVDTLIHFEERIIKMVYAHKDGELKKIAPEFIPEGRDDYEKYKRKLEEAGIW